MIESELVLAIIGETLDGVQFEEQITKQLPHLMEVEYEHMDSGLIVFIDHESSTVKQFRLNDEQLKLLFGDAEHELCSVELVNEALNVKAETSLHFANGILNRVEIWNALGTYPEDDLESWELVRIENYEQ